jgi:hypothetical protein
MRVPAFGRAWPLFWRTWLRLSTVFFPPISAPIEDGPEEMNKQAACGGSAYSKSLFLKPVFGNFFSLLACFKTPCHMLF